MVLSKPLTDLRNAAVEAYLAADAESESRLEYAGGEIVAMAGAAPNHVRITRNITVRLENQFGDGPCEAFASDLRVQVSPTQYRYPDVVVVCGTAQFANTKPQTLLNPIVIIEVLSDSTQEKDRGDKFRENMQIATLRDYILVTQTERRVLHYARQADNRWLVTEYTQADAVLSIESIGATLALTDIYRRIVFTA